MSWSFQIVNGDLAYGSGGLNTVTGASKLTQDLTCALLEPVGTDPLHPTFGSTLDGGTDPSGAHVEGAIGQINNYATGTFIGAEIQRVCRAYQSQQIARNTSDVSVYGKSTLTADEALLAVSGITVQQVVDHVLVGATLQTGVGNLPLSVPFTQS